MPARGPARTAGHSTRCRRRPDRGERNRSLTCMLRRCWAKKSPGKPWSAIPGLTHSSISERNVIIKAVVIRHLLRLRLLGRLLGGGLLVVLLLGRRARLLRTGRHAFTLRAAV